MGVAVYVHGCSGVSSGCTVPIINDSTIVLKPLAVGAETVGIGPYSYMHQCLVVDHRVDLRGRTYISYARDGCVGEDEV